MDEIMAQQLIKAAQKVREKAYAPYSGFKVGAALLGKSGRIYTGCNVENASYGATICAERCAVAQAIAAGENSFIALAVVIDAKSPGPPCGICRQFLSEFGTGIRLILANISGDVIETTLDQYFPAPFLSGSMDN